MSDPISGGPTPPPPPGFGQPNYGQGGYGSPYGVDAYGGYPPPMPGAGYRPAWQRPPQGMAVTALVLCCVFFMPLAVLVGIGLAIAVLVRSRSGVNYGRGKAITGLVIGGLVLLCWVALIAAAIAASSDVDRGGDGTAVHAGTISVGRLRLGDCFDQSGAPRGGDSVHVTTVSVVPCAQPHDWEVFHTFRLSGGAAYPGTDEVSRFAEGGCLDAYEPFTGAPSDAPGPDVFYIYPRASTWRLGDRLVQCVIGQEGGRFTGSLRGSGRSSTPSPSADGI